MKHSLLIFFTLCACSTPSPTPLMDAQTETSVTEVSIVDTSPRPDTSTPDASVNASCGTPYSMTQCNVITNAGCAAGLGCYLGQDGLGRNAQLCRAAGGAGMGDSCTVSAECREGFLCITPGRCAKLCCGDDDASCQDESRGGRVSARCTTPLTGGNGIKLCVADEGCDPFATTNNRCPSNAARCEPMGDRTFCRAALATAGGNAAPCCDPSQCQPGYLCISTGTVTTCDPARPNRRCAKSCNANAPVPDAVCPMGQTCSVRFGSESGLPTWFKACAPIAM
jgi:hypothetical protein